MEPTPEDIERYIAEGLDCEVVEVSGDGRHFQALIVSPAFEGQSRIARHQQIYVALGDRMRQEIHALSMRTLTPAEFRTQEPGTQKPGTQEPGMQKPRPEKP